MAGLTTLWPHVKLLAPGLVATLLLAALTVTTPVAKWIGTEVFLLVPNLYLFVYPANTTLGQHVETVVLSLLGGFLGLAISLLAVCGTVWIQGEGVPEYTDDQARAVAVMTLLILTFVGGCAASAYPRLKVAVRPFLLFASWVLTMGATRISYRIVSGYWYTLCLAGGASLLSKTLIFPTPASRGVSTLLRANLEATCQFLDLALHDFFAEPVAASGNLRELRSEMSTTVSKLPGVFQQAAQEFHYGRVDIATYCDLVGPMKRIKGWTAAGMGLRSLEASTPSKAAGLLQKVDNAKTEGRKSAIVSDRSSIFRPHVTALSLEVVHSLRLVQRVLDLIAFSEQFNFASWLGQGKGRSTFQQAAGSLPHNFTSENAEEAAAWQQDKLREAISDFNDCLEAALDTLRSGEADMDPQYTSRRDFTSPTTQNLWESSMYETAFFMISMFEIAREAEAALRASRRHLSVWKSKKHRSLFRSTVHWSKWLTNSSNIDSLEINLLSEQEEVSRASALAGVDTEQELYRRIFSHDIEAKSQKYLPHRSTALDRFVHSPNVIKARLATSYTLLWLRRNRHIKFGLKLAVGVTLLSIPAWIPTSRSWYLFHRGVWSLLSYIWIFEATSAATLKLAFLRLIGTIAGVLFGLIAHEASRRNPYALSFLETLFLIPSAYFVVESKHPALGLITGAALSIVTGVAYTAPIVPSSASPPSSAQIVALTRGCEVIVGIIAAVIVNLTLWPYHARVECVATLSQATSKANLLYTSLARQMLQAGLMATGSTQERFEKMEAALEKRLTFARTLIEVMNVEVSLVVKPIGVLTNITGHLERIISLLAALRQCRERGLRSNHTQAVACTFQERQTLVSSISLSFWAVTQALATRAPLPQFLPSPRAALEALAVALQEVLADKEAKWGEFTAGNGDGGAGEKAIPHAYYALLRAGDQLQWRGRRGTPNQSGTSTPLRSAPRSGTKPGHQGNSSIPATPFHLSSATQVGPKASVGTNHTNHAHFWVLAEQSLLTHIVSELEGLLDETRNLCGEVTFLDFDDNMEEKMETQGEHESSSASHSPNSGPSTALGGGDGSANPVSPSAAVEERSRSTLSHSSVERMHPLTKVASQLSPERALQNAQDARRSSQ